MEDFQIRLDEALKWLEHAYTGIRTGQATPALLDNIKVENYGSMMSINQVGSVGIEDARTLRVSTWDAGTIPALEKAITDADLGVSVATDSSGLRIMFPELTSERREQLIKIAKAKLEEARVSVRSARDETVKVIDTQQKNGEISEDEKFQKKEIVQKQVEESNKKLEELYQTKAQEVTI